jgi:riboflavin kinase/FMN adenylyltransferase
MDVRFFPDDQSPAWRDPVVALGNFDGIHRGHMRLLERVRRQAGERGGTPVALIFDPHPPRVLRPDKAPPLLMTLDQKLEAFARAGMQGVVIVRFTPELATW